MHIPVFSALAANTRWNRGAPDLLTTSALTQAHLDAPYWEKELRAGNMLTMDEGYHLQAFRFLSFINHAGFWSALLDHLGRENPTFWLPALDSAIEAGNLHALNALQTQGHYTRQDLFYEWVAFIKMSKVQAMPHPHSIAWFSQDSTLTSFLTAMSERTLLRNYGDFMLTPQEPDMWDVPSQTSGVQAILNRTREWCKLPDHVLTPLCGFQPALYMLVTLNHRDRDSDGHDPQGIHRGRASALAVKDALEQSVGMICQRLGLHLPLLRTLAGRMTAQDMQDPFLCAVAQFEDPFVQPDPHCISQGRAPMRAAQTMQIKNNATFAEPLPTMLDLDGRRGQPWGLYCIAEPFISKRSMDVIELPANMFDSEPVGQ